jgi:hemerythrin-like domain-containing protein
MQYSKPMQILVDEHTVIASVLDAVEAVANRADDAGEFPQEFYEKAFDFFATFADKCHHAKEEDQLFPLLESRGVPRDGGPIGCMLHEHEAGRAHVAAVRGALARTATGDRAARGTIRREALAYVGLLRQHILKENTILFVLGDQYLTGSDKAELLKMFNCAEHAPLPPGTHEKYMALADELTALSARS